MECECGACDGCILELRARLADVSREFEELQQRYKTLTGRRWVPEFNLPRPKEKYAWTD